MTATLRTTVIYAGMALSLVMTVPAQEKPAGTPAGQRDQPGAAPASQDNRSGAAAGQTDQSRTGRQDAATASRNRLENQSMVGPADQRFMMNAAQSGMMEVELAKHVQEKAESAEVKELAKKIHDDHSKANDELKKIAEARGVTLPSEMGPKHKADLDKMMARSGAALDKEYPKEVIKHHKKGISEFERASNNLVDTALRDFAKNTLPALREHLQAAQTVSGQTRSRTTTGTTDTQKTDARTDAEKTDKK